ncbi:hypothetical protein CBL_04897 [Carabus blaptoides fortunei]
MKTGDPFLYLGLDSHMSTNVTGTYLLKPEQTSSHTGQRIDSQQIVTTQISSTRISADKLQVEWSYHSSYTSLDNRFCSIVYPDSERRGSINRGLKAQIAPYELILQERRRAAEQPTLDGSLNSNIENSTTTATVEESSSETTMNKYLHTNIELM